MYIICILSVDDNDEKCCMPISSSHWINDYTRPAIIPLNYNVAAPTPLRPSEELMQLTFVIIVLHFKQAKLPLQNVDRGNHADRIQNLHKHMDLACMK